MNHNGYQLCKDRFPYLCRVLDPAPEHPHSLLTKQPNFRDIGGIPASNGKVVKRGMLYRSGDLSRLTEEDIRRIEEIGIRMIIDFRSDRELLNYPTPPIATVREKKRIQIIDSARDTAERMLAENDASGLETILIKDYRRMANDHQDDFREFLRVLALTDQLPLMYHCAAGKDRTGLATYLLLIALGVSPEEARKDYMLSNFYLKPVADRVIHKVKEAGNPNSNILRPLMEVRDEYLDAALDEIENQFGTADCFLTEILKVNQIVLQTRYLE